ncbi:hypothetical protein CDV52_18455 [Haematobacter missouriensis]|uniref:Uncharacterized protein n=1 Tax=Haematobacter missouriensis TaxID=366616 RepID=A0A212AIQ4_9RHOB|nr:hypothetical protein CDV52_18455 [Haematobacter missouriensis]
MHTIETKPSAANIADALGRRRMAEALGVRTTAVSNAVVRGLFPASWFLAVEALARAEGVACPCELFNFVIPKTEAAE